MCLGLILAFYIIFRQISLGTNIQVSLMFLNSVKKSSNCTISWDWKISSIKLLAVSYSVFLIVYISSSVYNSFFVMLYPEIWIYVRVLFVQIPKSFSKTSLVFDFEIHSGSICYLIYSSWQSKNLRCCSLS